MGDMNTVRKAFRGLKEALKTAAESEAVQEQLGKKRMAEGVRKAATEEIKDRITGQGGKIGAITNWTINHPVATKSLIGAGTGGIVGGVVTGERAGVLAGATIGAGIGAGLGLDGNIIDGEDITKAASTASTVGSSAEQVAKQAKKTEEYVWTKDFVEHFRKNSNVTVHNPNSEDPFVNNLFGGNKRNPFTGASDKIPDNLKIANSISKWAPAQSSGLEVAEKNLESTYDYIYDLMASGTF